MKYKLLAKQGNEGTNNGGSRVAQVKSAAELLPRVIGGDSDNPDKSNSSSGDISDNDLYSRYHGIKSGESTVADSFVAEEIDKEQVKFAADLLPDEIEEGDSKEEPDTKKESAKDESKDESEEDEVKSLLDLDIDKVKNGKGQPISSEASKTMKRFKSKLESLSKENEELKKVGKADPQLTEKLTTLEKENAEYKKRIDDEHFESSPAFKEAFIQPVVKATERVSSYFTGVDEKSDDAKEINALFAKAYSLAEKGDEAGYDKVVDSFIEDGWIEGTVRKGKFLQDMGTMFTSVLDKTKALTDKNEERKKIVERRIEDTRKANITGIDKDISSYIDRFKVERAPILEGLKGEQLKEYSDKIEASVPKVKKAIAEFAVTGKITGDLSEVIQKGIGYDAIDHERNLAWIAYKDSQNQIAVLRKQLEEKEKSLGKYTREPNKQKGSFTSTHESEKKAGPLFTPGKSSIAENLRKLVTT